MLARTSTGGAGMCPSEMDLYVKVCSEGTFMASSD